MFLYRLVICIFLFLTQEPYSNVDPYFITTANKERYRCIIPEPIPQEEEGSVNNESYTGPHPMQLLQPIFAQNSCSYRVFLYILLIIICVTVLFVTVTAHTYQ